MSTDRQRTPLESTGAHKPKALTRGHEFSGWRIVALWVLGCCVRIWSRTLRLKVSKVDQVRKAISGEPAVLVLWHNRLFAVPLLIRHLWAHRRISALVSASRDGGAFSKFLGFIGLSTVRGSSSRFGREAFTEMITALKAGSDIAITPDGPRGPVYKMKEGALLAARRARAPIVLVGIRYQKAWHLNSWDRFGIPKPFSTVEVGVHRYDTDTLPPDMEAVACIEQRLLELCGENPHATNPAKTLGSEAVNATPAQ